MTAFVLLSLFIGAVCGGMNDSLEAFKESEEKEAAAKIIKAKLKIDPKYAFGLLVAFLRTCLIDLSVQLRRRRGPG